jgi:hypothetical protein
VERKKQKKKIIKFSLKPIRPLQALHDFTINQIYGIFPSRNLFNEKFLFSFDAS